MRTSLPSVADLLLERNRLLFASRAPNTHTTYDKAWSAFEKFRLQYGYDLSIQPDVEQVAHFISFLSWHGYAGATISTYISGIAFGMQALGWPDVTGCFVIRRLVDGCRRKNARRDTRCPITLSILKSMINSLSHICNSTYDEALFRAAFLVAFFGFLRIGEFTAQSVRGPFSLSPGDVRVKGSISGKKLHVTIRRSKTDQTGKGCCIVIPPNNMTLMCPLKAVEDYLSLRSKDGCAFFQHFDTRPLTRHEFSRTLKRVIGFIGLPVAFYSSHSFRIGAATAAAMAGVPDACIQKMGRWASHAHRRYIRTGTSVLVNQVNACGANIVVI